MLNLGLIGYPLGHSKSPQLHEGFMQEQNIIGKYTLIPLPTASEFEQFMRHDIFEYNGINITIPYKRGVLQYCEQLSPEAQAIQAVNTIVIKNNKRIGYNTDCAGFMLSILPFKDKISKALILGTGGSSAAVKYVLDALQINHTFVSRNPQLKQLSYPEITSQLLSNYQLIVNCTPLGMHPLEKQCAPIDYAGINSNHICIDLVYNPTETLFLKKCKQQGATAINGEAMLTDQALFAFQLFTQ